VGNSSVIWSLISTLLGQKILYLGICRLLQTTYYSTSDHIDIIKTMRQWKKQQQQQQQQHDEIEINNQ
jgi:hypothetical protein